MKRKSLGRGKSRRMFKHSSNRVHKKNVRRPLVRGGIRL